MALRSIPIRRSGNRPNLFMGADRELLMFSGLLTGILIFSVQDLLAFFFGCLLWLFSLWSLRLMAKADPRMREVYLRQLRYQRYYPARSTPFRVNTHGQGRQYK